MTLNWSVASRKVRLCQSRRSENVVWHGGHVGRADRAERLGQKGGTVWFTGLSGSGKSTVAVAVEPFCISWTSCVSARWRQRSPRIERRSWDSAPKTETKTSVVWVKSPCSWPIRACWSFASLSVHSDRNGPAFGHCMMLLISHFSRSLLMSRSMWRNRVIQKVCIERHGRAKFQTSRAFINEAPEAPELRLPTSESRWKIPPKSLMHCVSTA